MTDAELVEVRERLEAFAAELFAPMRRNDQRRWGCVYLRGLMLDGRRKSIDEKIGEEHVLRRLGRVAPLNSSMSEWIADRTERSGEELHDADLLPRLGIRVGESAAARRKRLMRAMRGRSATFSGGSS